MSLPGSENNRRFTHDCGQEVIVLGWTHGFWRRPNAGESVVGAMPLKGDICTCGRSLTEKSSEFTGELFGKETA